jgi:hypothetical protein
MTPEEDTREADKALATPISLPPGAPLLLRIDLAVTTAVLAATQWLMTRFFDPLLNFIAPPRR